MIQIVVPPLFKKEEEEKDDFFAKFSAPTQKNVKRPSLTI